jgi:threonine dehydratase
MSGLAVSYDDIASAHRWLSGIVRLTPCETSTTANAMTGGRLFFKCENLQRMGAFKFRGACNALRQFTEEQRRHGVVAYSSGNHAQAIALSAQRLQMRAVIVMPHDAPQSKVDATKGYGAEVVTYHRSKENREEIGQRLAEQEGMTLIPPFDHPHVIAGQGTVAKELCEQAKSLDMLLVPLGGGGLLAGCALAAKALMRDCRVIGVEPEAGNDVQQSLRSGTRVHIDVPDTIADGAQTQQVGAHNYPIIQKYVDNIVTVSDDELIETMKFFFNRMKMVVEPTGCLAAAAVLEGKVDIKGKRVGIVLSGGNIDVARFNQLTAG